MEAQQTVRFTLQNETTNENLKDAPKETVQQSVTTSLQTIRTEVLPTEVESKNNARNEKLIQEMQNVFKRSNFGQAVWDESSTH